MTETTHRNAGRARDCEEQGNVVYGIPGALDSVCWPPAHAFWLEDAGLLDCQPFCS